MLGEAALTAADARGFLRRLCQAAIAAIARAATSTDVARNPGISVKLSALHPRYEDPAASPRHGRARAARQQLCARRPGAGSGFNIDAEEADRLTCRST
jgi:RHH-type proline utilization regulon transcriptional repressor/proline dehydrogenase/delta 1-pyrroline-5-carboxylate dehydrogenase